jgi:hypothetical protein
VLLTGDVGLGGGSLRIQGVEFLLQAFFGGLPTLMPNLIRRRFISETDEGRLLSKQTTRARPQENASQSQGRFAMRSMT